MRFLALCRPSPGADRSAFGAHIPAEMAVLRKLTADGLLIEAYTVDGPGAVLILEAITVDEARYHVDGLPLRIAGLIDVELIAIHPLPIS